VQSNPASKHLAKTSTAMSRRFAATDIIVSMHGMLSEDPPAGTRVIDTSPLPLGNASSCMGVLSHVGGSLDMEQYLFRWEGSKSLFYVHSLGFHDPYRFVVQALVSANALHGTSCQLDVILSDLTGPLVHGLQCLNTLDMTVCLQYVGSASSWRLSALGTRHIRVAREVSMSKH
jgi:hypothetical protein